MQEQAVSMRYGLFLYTAIIPVEGLGCKLFGIMQRSRVRTKKEWSHDYPEHIDLPNGRVDIICRRPAGTMDI